MQRNELKLRFEWKWLNRGRAFARWNSPWLERSDIFVTYRGVYRDYRLRLADGQELSATLTQRLPLTEGDPVEVGIRAADVILLEED